MSPALCSSRLLGGVKNAGGTSLKIASANGTLCASEFCMSYVITAQVIGNEQAQTLIEALKRAGIPQDAIGVIEAASHAEHRDDRVSGHSLAWGLLGAAICAAIGWIVMMFWSMPWLGALWGAVVGAICGARTGGEAVTTHLAGEGVLNTTRIKIEAQGHYQAERARHLCIDHRAWPIRVVGRE